MKNIKILCAYKVPSFYVGGIPRFIMNLYSNNLNTFKNKQITIISINNEYKKKVLLKEYNKGLNEIIFPPILKFKTISFSIKFFIFILLNSRKYNYIHYQHPDPITALGVIISKLYSPKTNIIITWHADIYKNYVLFSPILLLIDFILYLLSEKIIYLTPLHLKSSLFGNLPIFLKKTHFIPVGIKLPKNISEKKEPLKNKKFITLISVCRLVKYKGLEISIKSMKILLKTRPDINFKYLIIGSGPEEMSLKNLVNKLGLDKYIIFKGEIDNEAKKNKYLKNSDIYLFPSINQSEAYGLSQLEALSMGVPIINTNLNNGVNYLVPHNICGITVKKLRPDLIYEAIVELYENNSLYFNLSKKGIDRSKELNIEKTRKLYSKLFK